MCYNVHILASDKLHVGHNDLDQPMLVDLTEANNNIIHPIIAWLVACGGFVPPFKLNVPNSEYKWLL